jgi:hypothetical protein
MATLSGQPPSQSATPLGEQQRSQNTPPPDFNNPNAWKKAPDVTQGPGQFLPGAGANTPPDASAGSPGRVVLGGGGPSTTIKAHDTDLTNPEYQKEMQEGIAGEKEAVEGEKATAGALGVAKADVAETTGQALGGEAATMEEGKERLDKEAKGRADKLEPYQAAYKAAADEMSAFHMNPGRLYQNMGTFDKVRMGLASIVGGFYAGWTGREDPVQKLVTQKIQMDVEAQKMEYDALKEKGIAAKSLYSMAREQGLDEKDSTAAAIQMGIQQAKVETQSLVARAGGKVDLAAANDTISKLDAESAKFGPLATQEKIREHQWVQPKTVGGGGGVDMAAVRKDAILYGKEHPESTPQQALAWSLYLHGGMVPGTGEAGKGQFYTKPEKAPAGKTPAANEATASKLAQLESSLADLDDVIAQRTRQGGGTLSAPNTATMGGKMSAIRIGVDHALAGRVSETTLHELKALFPEDPNAYSPLGTTDAQLQSAKAFLTRQRDTFQNELKAGPSGAVSPAAPPTSESLGITP